MSQEFHQLLRELWKTPVIFLDIDGVLNTAESYRLMDTEPERFLLSGKLEGDVIDREILINLEALYYKLKVVTSGSHYFSGTRPVIIGVSSWFTKQKHVEMVNKMLYPTLRIHAKAAFTGGGIGRGDSLLEAIKYARLQHYVILDDANENMYRKEEPLLWDHLVQIDGMVGMTAKDALKAFDIIMNVKGAPFEDYGV